MEWLRFVTIGLALLAITEWIIFFGKHKEPGAIAPITWLINALGYTIFKAIVKSDPYYYNVSVTWSNAMLIHGILLLIVAVYIYRGYKKWTYNH
jgi:hypothetical protein